MSSFVESSDPGLILRGIPKAFQHMKFDKAFYSHAAPNVVIAAIVVGVLTRYFGLDIAWAVAAVIVGNLLFVPIVALLGLIGPKSRQPQMQHSRTVFGRGVVLPAILNWLSCIGWDAINNVPSAAALLILVTGKLTGEFTSLQVLVALAVLAAIQMFVAICGHDVVQWIQKYLGIVMVAIFLLIGGVAAFNAAGTSGVNEGAFDFWMFVLSVSVVGSFNLAWAVYSSDYTRHLPADTPQRPLFNWISLGLFASAVIMELFGVIIGGLIKIPTPGNTMGEIALLVGGLWPLAMLAIAVSSITVNSENDYTGAASLITGLNAIKPDFQIKRWKSAALSSILAFFVALVIYGNFAGDFEQFMLVILYWVGAWSALVIVDHFLIKHQPVLPEGTEPKYPSAFITRGTAIFVVVSAITIWLFASTGFYTGPVAKMIGGSDIGYFVSTIAAGLLYWLSYKIPLFGLNKPASVLAG